jgi:hypothetical protein
MKSSPVTRWAAPAERRPDLMPTRLYEPEAFSGGPTRLVGPGRDAMTEPLRSGDRAVAGADEYGGMVAEWLVPLGVVSLLPPRIARWMRAR